MSAKRNYVYGNAVRKADLRLEVYNEPTHRTLKEMERKREKRRCA